MLDATSCECPLVVILVRSGEINNQANLVSINIPKHANKIVNSEARVDASVVKGRLEWHKGVHNNVAARMNRFPFA